MRKKWKRPTKRQCLDRTKKNAAYHEAGHYVIGRHFRIPTQAWLFIDKKTYQIDGKTKKFSMWIGNCETRGFSTLTRHQEKMHLVAGAIAEIIWERHANDDQDHGNIPDWMEIEENMSPSDLTTRDDIEPVRFNDLSEHEWKKWWKAIEEVYALFNRKSGPLWPTVMRAAARLYSTTYIYMPHREWSAAQERMVNAINRQHRRNTKSTVAASVTR
jgi:hypothetical protein